MRTCQIGSIEIPLRRMFLQLITLNSTKQLTHNKLQMVVFNFQTQKLAKLGQKTSKTAKIETSKPATAETQKAESVYILGNDR